MRAPRESVEGWKLSTKRFGERKNSFPKEGEGERVRNVDRHPSVERLGGSSDRRNNTPFREGKPAEHCENGREEACWGEDLGGKNISKKKRKTKKKKRGGHTSAALVKFRKRGVCDGSARFVPMDLGEAEKMGARKSFEWETIS